jgi:copper transport protein
MKRPAVALILMLAVGFVALRPDRALGHAALVRADPAPNSFLQRAPAQVSLSFAEALDESNSVIRLLDANGSEIKLPKVQFSSDSLGMNVQLPALQPGIYNVLYANISRVDGHALSGSYPFTVLNPDGSVPLVTNQVSGIGTDPDPPPLDDGIAVRALSLLGLAIIVAGALLVLLWNEAGVAARKGLEATAYFGAGVLGTATLLNLQTIRSAYSATTFTNLVFHTPAGGYWLTRVGVVMLVAVAATFFREAPRRTAAAILLISGVYLWAFTATSHAAAGNGSGWARGLDFLHGAAALLWIGAVIGVAVSARLLQRDGKYGVLLPRFSLLASVLVFVLLTTGSFNSFIEIDTPSKLWETRYGITLLVKVGIMAPLLLVGLYNARIGRRRLIALAQGEPARFIRVAAFEALLGIAVFGAAAVMTQTTVSKNVLDTASAKAYDRTATANDLSVRLLIDPNRTGVNTYTVKLTVADKAVDAERVRLTFRYKDDQTVGPSTLTLAAGATGTFVGQGPYLTLEGNWRVEAEVRRANVDDATGFFDVRPAGTQVTGISRDGPWGNPTPGLGWNELAGLVLLVVGFGFALFRGNISGFGRRYGWAANVLTMGGFSFGVLLLFGVHSHTLPGTLPTNPIFPDQNSVSQGKALYQQNCISCHGQTGVPPSGLKLDPYPLDLTVHVPQHPDGQLYNFIAHGIVGSAMPAWGDTGKLTPDQMWHVVNYLRTLGSADQ